MPAFILGKKSIQTQQFDKNGESKNIKKPVQKELEKAGIKTPLRFLREFRLEEYKDKVKLIEDGNKKGVQIGEVKIFSGDVINPNIFIKSGDLITVSGISKGKGFQGGVKRHGFKGRSHTHGASRDERAPGSIGMSTTPGRVFKGKRMAGRMGGDRVTIKNIEVIEVKENGLLIKGLIPGAKGGLIEVRG
ncbi:MAG: 50S ribosomal protein L3 [Candidatus Roizmanbacteria bacterium GW2011_GWA2_34_18]|uniref:Large ribosomal subunit protein uL3 n=1 Tax=Candidatus Roizmanbacteria bacterium GW2011_GWA2_34_18 TaxID=1618477 RepID=A0A0G0BAC8_9BACT|nr:MAG: 50S ribosomal protein L3 [Candidatus Roizmanbacteria bacterium GW2011_GWA2_34_18]